MRRKVVIAVAPVKHPGSEMPAGCRNPQSADDIAAEVVACARAGASMVHLHVRDESGVQTAEMDVFARTLDLIRGESDIVIQGSTGGVSTLSLEERGSGRLGDTRRIRGQLLLCARADSDR